MPKCADCGFLAARDQKTRALKETEAGMREAWAIPADPLGGRPCYDLVPICFARKIDFEKLVGPENSRAKVIPLIHEDRQCDSFTEWLHGRSPREHEEMKLAEDQKAFQARQREADLKFQADLREADRRWQAEQKDKELAWQDAQNRKSRQAQYVSGLVGALAGALFGFLFGKSDPPARPDNPPAITSPATSNPTPAK